MIPWNEFMHARIEETINWLEGYLRTQTDFRTSKNIADYSNWSVQLGRDLVNVGGARAATVAAVGQSFRVDLFGIRASATSGLDDACRNWLTKARANFGVANGRLH